MKVKDLIRKLKSKDGELEVFIPVSNGIGNISGVDTIKDSTYGFFGKQIPCILLEK